MATADPPRAAVLRCRPAHPSGCCGLLEQASGQGTAPRARYTGSTNWIRPAGTCQAERQTAPPHRVINVALIGGSGSSSRAAFVRPNEAFCAWRRLAVQLRRRGHQGSGGLPPVCPVRHGECEPQPGLAARDRWVREPRRHDEHQHSDPRAGAGERWPRQLGDDLARGQTGQRNGSRNSNRWSVRAIHSPLDTVTALAAPAVNAATTRRWATMRVPEILPTMAAPVSSSCSPFMSAGTARP